MTKRLSVTLSDDEYKAIVIATAEVMKRTNATTNPTEYVRNAINTAVCRDLNVACVSDLFTENKEE